MHLPHKELFEVDTVRRDNEQLLDTINTLHSQLRSQQDLHTPSSDRVPSPYVRLRNLYEAAVRLAQREEDALLSCLERIDEIVSTSTGGAVVPSSEISSATMMQTTEGGDYDGDGDAVSATNTNSTIKRESQQHVPTTMMMMTTTTSAPMPTQQMSTSATTTSTKMAAPTFTTTTATSKGRPSSSATAAAAGATTTTTASGAPLKKRAKTEPQQQQQAAAAAAPVVSVPTTLSTPTSASASYEYLYPEESRSIAQGREVAAKVSGTKENGFWILAAVTKYFPDKHRYEVVDVDDTETRKRYILPSKSIVALPDKLPQQQLSKGDHVIAMFPDTTTFYPAIVEVPPNKQKKKNKDDYSLIFEDDEMPSRFINFKFVVQIPKQN